jgi:hypothetical protein
MTRRLLDPCQVILGSTQDLHAAVIAAAVYHCIVDYCLASFIPFSLVFISLQQEKRPRTLLKKKIFGYSSERKNEEKRGEKHRKMMKQQQHKLAQTTDSANTDEPKLKNNIHSERERDFSFSTCAVREPHTWRSPARRP